MILAGRGWPTAAGQFRAPPKKSDAHLNNNTGFPDIGDNKNDKHLAENTRFRDLGLQKLFVFIVFGLPERTPHRCRGCQAKNHNDFCFNDVKKQSATLAGFVRAMVKKHKVSSIFWKV